MEKEGLKEEKKGRFEPDGEIYEELLKYGKDIMDFPGMQKSKQFVHHGDVSVYEHSLHVAASCLAIARKLKWKVDERALVRGALMHDYFQYDWHEPDRTHRWHGFIHARRALRNAERDFSPNEVERNMIETHMFPLNLRLPRYRESVILTIADKICSVQETTARRG